MALSPVVDGALGMLRPIMPATAAIDSRYNADLPLALIDKVQIYQLVMNLCIIARDAMGGQGAISVTTDLFRGEGECCAACGQPVVGDFICPTVSDCRGIGTLTLKLIEPVVWWRNQPCWC